MCLLTIIIAGLLQGLMVLAKAHGGGHGAGHYYLFQIMLCNNSV